MELNKKAFTLIELLVVVLIIGILASVALPQYQIAVEKSIASEGISLIRSIVVAQEAYRLANGDYTKNILDLDLDFPGRDYQAGESSIATKATRYWNCRATSASGPYQGSIIALCRRVPDSKYGYYFYIMPDNNKKVISCYYDDASTGRKWCQRLTGKTSFPYTF